MKNWPILILLFCQLPLAFGKQEGLKARVPWSNTGMFGEGQYSSDYVGPLWPITTIDRMQSNRSSVSEGEDLPVLMSNLYAISDLQKIWFEVLPQAESCPDDMLNVHGDYLHYMFRLLTLSYAFESLKEIHFFLAHIQGEDFCPIEARQLWQGCKGRTEDMEKFLRRAINARNDDFIDKMAFPRQKKYLEEWWKNEITKITQGKASERSFPAQYLAGLLNQNKIQSPLNHEVAKQKLSLLCKSIRTDLKLVCQEQDNFFGFQEIPEVRILLERSHAFSLINQEGFGHGCMQRFININRRRQNKNIELWSEIYPGIMSSLARENAPYLQGKLFLMGAMHEFENKGLAGLFFEEKSVSPTPTPLPIATPKVGAKATPVPTATPTATATIVAVVQPTPTPDIQMSQFEQAVSERNRFNADKVAVNMGLARIDYPLSDKVVVAMREPIKNFQTRQALKDMKELDKLGSKETPVHLRFLKFLIDYEYHQGLFNIQSELGEVFWVINDFEKGRPPQLIELLNNESTQNKWQIYVLRPR